MNDRFKFRYVFEKDFGGKTGICYKIPVFDLDDAVRSVFENKIIEYTNFGYKLIAKTQCTGLKDKNGKLIYDGDIVQFYDDGVLKTMKIVWDDDELDFKAIGLKKSVECYERDFSYLGCIKKEDSLEVIGNVYENKELLNDSL